MFWVLLQNLRLADFDVRRAAECKVVVDKKFQEYKAGLKAINMKAFPEKKIRSAFLNQEGVQIVRAHLQTPPVFALSPSLSAVKVFIFFACGTRTVISRLFLCELVVFRSHTLVAC